MKNIVFYILFIVLGTQLYKCNSNKQYTNSKGKQLHYVETDLLELNAVAYHINDSVTDVLYEVKNDNLLYKRTDTSNAYYAEVKVRYTLVAEENLKKILDSSSFYLLDREEAESIGNKVLVNQFSMNVDYGKDYYLRIETIDLNRKSVTLTTLKINKHDKLNGQNFLLKLGGKVAYKNTFFKNQTISIQTSNTYIKKLFVHCYTSESKAALPPFSKNTKIDFRLKPDSIFEVNIMNGQFILNMPEHGFYFIKASNESDVGFCLFTYDPAFPSVSNMGEMIMSCRYIMYKDEFDSCRLASDKKNAIDNFWLRIGGSNERAREVIKKYYARVKEANMRYSSYIEGWKTDRGMISIIFGQATNVYTSSKDEIWVYGLETNPSTLRFVFKRIQSPFSENDFVLERADYYKESYYQAVDYWRQGIVYSEKGLDR